MSKAKDAYEHLRAKRWDEARSVYTLMTTASGESAEGYYGLALLAMRESDESGAERLLLECLGHDSGHQGALYFLGKQAARAGRVEEARERFRSVLRLNPAHPAARTALAELAVAPVSNAAQQPPVASSASASPEPPHPPRRSDSVVGLARSVSWGSSPFNGAVGAARSLSLRLEVIDRPGTSPRFLDVSMAGFVIQGRVENGDWIEVPKSKNFNSVNRLYNLTTGSEIRKRAW